LLNYLDNYTRITIKEFSKLVQITEEEASDILVKLVRAGVIQIHTTGNEDYFTLA
jgi:DNA-binding Lrp family transcriptional regulator